MILGNLTATTAGSSLLVGKAISAGTGTLAITTATPSDAQGIYGGRTVWLNGTANTGYDWATSTGPVSGNYTLAAYSGYVALAASGTDTNNSRITASNTPGGSITTNSLKIENPAASQSLALGTNLLTLTSGGLLSTGTNAFTISGTAGTTELTAGSASNYDLVVHQYNSASGGLTISAVIGDNAGNAVSLTKAGSGTLTLSGANTYTGGTYLNTGTLAIGNGSALGSGTLTINGGVLSLSTSLTNNNPIVVNNGFTLAGANNMNTGSGTFKIARPLTITFTSDNNPYQGAVIPSVITDMGGGNTLNALDITYTATSSTQGLTLGGAITLRSNQTLNVLGLGQVTTGFTVAGAIGDDGNGYGVTFVNGGATSPGYGRGPGVFLSGTNTYSGDTVINPGAVVTLGRNGTSGSLSPSSAIINNGIFGFYRSDAILQGTAFNSVISGSGAVVQGGGGTTTLNGTNTYTGTTSVNGGTLSVALIPDAGTAGPLGAYPNAGAAGIVLGGGTLKYTGATASTNRGVTVSANSTINVTPTSGNTALTMGASSIGAFTLTVSGSAGSSLNLGTVTLTGNAILAPASGIPLTVASVSGTTQSLTMNGAGTVLLNGTNTYAGGTTLTAGTLNISNDNNLGTGALTFNGGALQFATSSAVTVAAGRAVVINSGKTAAVDTSLADGVIASTISGSGNLSKSTAGALTLNAANTFTGTTTVSGGRIVLGNTLALQNSPYVTTGSNGSTIGIDVNGYATPTLGGLSGAVNLASAIIGYSGVTGVTLNQVTTATNQTYSGIIADCNPGVTATGLAKSGEGIQILSGANTYTGATNISGGVLRINGNQSSATGATGISAGALGGTGTVGGNVTLSGIGGIDLRDAATGTLTINGNLAINGAAGSNKFYFDLANGATTDKIVVNGNVTMPTPNAAVIVFNQLSGGRVTAGTPYNLIQVSGTMNPSLSDFTLPTTAAFGSSFTLGLSGNTLQVTTTQLASGSATAWTGGSATTDSWTDGTNWSAGVPGYTSAVTMYNTAARLTNTLDGDVDIASLTYPATATTATTINKGTLSGQATGTLTLENAAGITANTPSSGTVTHTINANVGLAANQTWTVGSASASNNATLAIGGNVTDLSGLPVGGGYTLSKAGAGTVNLNGNTTIGSLNVGFSTNPNNVNYGTVAVGSGGSMTIGSGSTSFVNIGVGSGSTNNGNLWGTLDVSAATNFTANVGAFKVGGTIGGIGYLYLGGTSTITAATEFGVEHGSWGFPNGFGTVTTAAASTTTIHTPAMYVGHNTPNSTTGGNGSFTLGASGATLALDGLGSGRAALYIGVLSSGNGGTSPNPNNMDLSAGSASLKLSSLVLGQSQGGNNSVTGLLTFSSNVANHLDISGAGNVVLIGDSAGGGTPGATGTLTIGNLDATSAITSTDNNTAILLANKRSTGTPAGTLNLNGGTLTITTTGSAIAGGNGTSTLNLNGGTLKAGASSSTFINNLSNAYVQGGGVTIDTGANNVTVPQALLKALSTSPTVNYGLALTSLTPTAGGSGYSMTAPPTVTFSAPTGGKAATGFAVVNPAGQVTGIVITSPGSGYANGATATITLSGSGGATFTNPTATVDQSVGGLTKAGSGMLTLTAVNTYTGATTVNNGTLALGAANVLPDASNVSLGAATLDAATFTDTAGTLAVTGAAAIHLGAGAALAFADSHLVSWSGTLNLTGTFVSGSSLRFGIDINGLTAAQLASISSTGFSAFALNANGYLTASSGATLDHFAISTISSPQTLGTPITGITITAQDASNNTFTGFAGTVDFSGTAGITGTSGTFTNGQLTGLSLTPLNSGTGLTFVVTATGGSATGTATFNVQTQYEAWAAGAGFTADSNNDGVPNGLAWLLGAGSPSANATGLLPVASQEGGKLVMTFDCLKTASRGPASLKVQYSTDLGAGDPWTNHEVVVPDAGGTDPGTGIVFTVTPVNATLNHVKAAIPTTGKVFGRLSGKP